MSTVVPLIQKILEYRKEGTVIDIGAGQGHHALFLAEHGFAVTALDTDASLVEQLSKTAKERNLSVVTKIGDVRDLADFESHWDIVICTFVLHFLRDEEIGKAIFDLRRITRSGGLNVVAVHTDENVTETDRKPHLFTPTELQECYADWKTLYYWQGLGKPFVSKRTGEVLEKYRADLIAQKP